MRFHQALYSDSGDPSQRVARQDQKRETERSRQLTLVKEMQQAAGGLIDCLIYLPNLLSSFRCLPNVRNPRASAISGREAGVCRGAAHGVCWILIHIQSQINFYGFEGFDYSQKPKTKLA